MTTNMSSPAPSGPERGTESAEGGEKKLTPAQELDKKINDVTAEMTKTRAFLAALQGIPKTDRTIKNIAEAQATITALEEHNSKLKAEREVIEDALDKRHMTPQAYAAKKSAEQPGVIPEALMEGTHDFGVNQRLDARERSAEARKNIV